MQAEGDVLALRACRVHEAQGFGRHGFALWQAARHAGPVIWISPSHLPHMPMLRGLPEGLAARLHLIRPKTEADLLWTIEETLRAPAVGLVIAEPQKPLSLLAGRRMQLAAEAGKTTGLLLIQEDKGSNAAETRWTCQPLPSDRPDSTLHEWALNKNKRGTLNGWTVDWHGETTALHMVCAAG